MTAITIPNTFVPSTTISSTEMNANFQAVAAAIEDSVAIDGSDPMTGPLHLPNGTDAAPSLAFTTDPDTGLYSHAANAMGVAAAGASVGRFTSAGWVQANAMGSVVTGPLSAVATQVFTASGTYTPTAGMKYCRVRIQAPGGGGGGADGVGDGGGTNGTNGGGGGGGEYAEGWFTAAQIGASQAVTIGAVGAAGSNTGGDGGTGGTTSLGALLTAIGGTGGTGSGSDSTSSSSRSGGAGGNGGTGSFFQQRGGTGGNGMSQRNITVQLTWGGAQGGSFFAPTGTPSNAQGGSSSGTNGIPYGQGGRGGFVQSTTGVAGGSGGAGIVIVEEFG